MECEKIFGMQKDIWNVHRCTCVPTGVHSATLCATMGKPHGEEKTPANRVARDLRNMIRASKIGKRLRSNAQKGGLPAEFVGLVDTVKAVEESHSGHGLSFTATSVLEYIGELPLGEVKTLLEAAGAQSKPGLAWWASVIRRIWKQRVYEAKGRHRKDQRWRDETIAYKKKVRLLNAKIAEQTAMIQTLKKRLANLVVIPE